MFGFCYKFTYSFGVYLSSKKTFVSNLKQGFSLQTDYALYLLYCLMYILLSYSSADPDGGSSSGPPPPPLKNHKNIGFISNTGPDLLKNHKAAKQDSMSGHHPARQCNAIDGQLISL